MTNATIYSKAIHNEQQAELIVSRLLTLTVPVGRAIDPQRYRDCLHLAELWYRTAKDAAAKQRARIYVVDTGVAFETRFRAV